jgi:hypothetical protein
MLPLILAMALLGGAAHAATRVKGHWDSRGRWVSARWVNDVEAETVARPSRAVSVADATFRLDLDFIWKRPFRGEEEVSPPPGLAMGWRQALRPKMHGGDHTAKVIAPSGGVSDVMAALNRVRRSRGAAALEVEEPPVQDGVVWTETATHRIKTRYEGGRVAGRWEYEKVSGSGEADTQTAEVDTKPASTGTSAAPL